MRILRASEDYLETMLMLQQEVGYIRSVDVAQRLRVSKPSVTNATKRLRESGHITMEPDGRIVLTPAGMEVAVRMLERHRKLTDFLMKIGVERETAEADACKMEHDITEDTYRALCAHIDKTL